MSEAEQILKGLELAYSTLVDANAHNSYQGTLIHAKVVGYRRQVKLESENLASRELAKGSKSNNKDTDNEK